MIKGAAEFYRNFPNVWKKADGKCHIHNVNDREPILCAQNTMSEVAAMHGIFPVAIRAAEILGADKELRTKWQEFVDNLVPLPTGDDPDSLDPRELGMPTTWARGREPAKVPHKRYRSPHLVVPAVHHDLCTLESDPKLWRIANAAFELLYSRGVGPETPASVLSWMPIAAAMLGRAYDVKYLIPSQMKLLRMARDGRVRPTVLENRMSLAEGEQAVTIEHLGRASETRQLALLQSVPAGPGGEPIIRVFPAWPREWDADFSLLARGAFMVCSSIRNGKIGFVEIKALVGGVCRLRNPWGKGEATLYRNGRKDGSISGELLEF